MKYTKKRTQSSKAVKASEKLEEDEEDSFEDDDDDVIAHLKRRILKAWIKRKKKCFVPKKDKKGKAKQDEIICFECKEAGHVRS